MVTKFEPWFGDWPPEKKGGSSMEDTNEHKLLQLIPYGAFVLVGLVGGILVAHVQSFWHEFGYALIIASVIGLTIEVTFVRQLARHVFEIAFGYLLRKEIANEIRWIYQMDMLVTSYTHEFTFEKCAENSEKIWVNETFIRTVKNIGNKCLPIKPSLGIEEWFHNEGRSEIVSYQITHKDGKVLYPNDKKKLTIVRPIKHKQEHYIIAIKEDDLEAKMYPGNEYTIVGTYKELRPINADTVSFFGAPSMNPEITVKVVPGMDYDLTFGNRRQPELRFLGNNHWRLDTMILPGQAIRLRWWKKSDSEKWEQEVAEKYPKTEFD